MSLSNHLLAAALLTCSLGTTRQCCIPQVVQPSLMRCPRCIRNSADSWLFCSRRARSATGNGSANSSADLPYSQVPTEELRDRLELSIRAEDYEVAAAIRDEIKERESSAEVAVREAHQQFYNAFGAGDIKAMDKVWGRGDHLRILHPGSEGIYGRDDVMESWKLILAGGGMNITLEQVQIYAVDNLAMVTCVEVMHSSNAMGRTAATNILERQQGRWVMIHHQGGPLPMRV